MGFHPVAGVQQQDNRQITRLLSSALKNLIFQSKNRQYCITYTVPNTTR
jgi:hypothetical protein